jgi:DNA-binding CsgD family transcriptional regulator
MEPVSPIGRGALLAQVHKVLDMPGARVALVGEPGIGKTTALTAAIEALGSSCRVIWVTASEVERMVGLAVASDMAGLLAEELAILPDHVREALTSVASPTSRDTGPIDLRVVGAAFGQLFAEAARVQPVVLAVDDFQWVDEASYVLITYALRRTGTADVRAIVGQRPSEDRSLAGATTVGVGPIDAGSLRGLVGSQLARVLTAEVAAALHDAVGGNPMYALETVRGLPPDATAADVRLPSNLMDLVVSRVTALPAECRTVLLQLAVRGRARLTELPGHDDLDPAFDARIVQRRGAVVEFTHPLLRQGVIDAVGPTALRKAHGAAALAATDPAIRALHIAAVEPHDDENAADELEHASIAAFRIGDEAAAQLLARASVKATPEGRLTWSRLACLARARAFDERLPANLVNDLLALATTPDEEAGTWLVVIEGAAAPNDEWQELAKRTLAIEGTSPGIILRAANTLTEAMLFAGSVLTEQVAVLDQAISRAKEQWTRAGVDLDALTGSDAAGLADCLSSRALFTRMAGTPVAAQDLDLARRLVRDRMIPPWFEDATSVLGLLAMWDDRHEEARSWFEEDYRGDDGLRIREPVHLAELECRLGNLNAVERLRTQFTDTDEPYALFVMAHAAAWRGDEQDCHQMVRLGRDVAARVERRMFLEGLDTAEALLDLGLGRFADAREKAMRAASTLEDRGCREPSWIPALPIAIEAAAISGSHADAELMLDRLQRQAEMLDSRWARAAAQRGRATLLGVEGDAREGLAVAISSAEAFEQLTLPTEAGWSALVAGRLARRAGERTLAREWLQRSIDLLEPRGCAGFVAQARNELTRLSGRRASQDDLTDAERHVAELAATGMSNSEIAAAAFLSVKTVEAHLSRVYRKLGVRSRAELAARWEG